jgi:hypothetical protein
MPADPDAPQLAYVPNPNVGRVYVNGTGQYNNFGANTESESLRLTAFAEYNFADRHADSWWGWLLGKQTLTGLLSNEESDRDSRSWTLYGTPDSYGAQLGGGGYNDFFSNDRQFNFMAYMGDSLIDVSSPGNANIPGIKGEIRLPSTITQWYFDTTWRDPSIDPGAPWVNPRNTSERINQSTQSENPNNYVGWRTQEMEVLSARDGDRDLLTRDILVTNDQTESKALVLQSQWMGGALTTMYGWREDTNKVYTAIADKDPVTKRVIHGSARLADEPDNEVTVESNSWSAALHLNRIWKMDDMLPVDVRVYYNESENFRPAASRINLYGQNLQPPSGQTTDYSVLLSTKDNRYSLRVTKYETSVVDQSTTAGLAQRYFFFGQFFEFGRTAADRYDFKISSGTIGAAPDEENTYEPRPGQTAAQAAAEEAAHVAGWRALEEQFFALSEELTGDPYGFYRTWNSDPVNYDPAVGVDALREPPGFTLTEDSVSEGYEFEFTASPTSNWRIAFNAAQTEAQRSNVGGTAFNRHVALMEDLLNNTAAGQLRRSSGRVDASTMLEYYNSGFAPELEKAKLQDGKTVAELREWRFNVVSNYTFTEGTLEGLNLGGGYRWQDKIAIDYPLFTDSEGNTQFDLDNPYYGPSEDNVDLLVGYKRQLTDKVH